MLRHCDHYSKTTEARFWASVKKMPNGCWEWQGYVDPAGYGQIFLGKNIPHISVNEFVHRYAYELLKGPIPEGLTIDHLCRNRRCVCPDHLEAVTFHENLFRGDNIAVVYSRRTHCKHGHEYTPENTRIYREHRRCKKCQDYYNDGGTYLPVNPGGQS
jgi:hypothetical protein